MGMTVIGLNPTSERGSCFRNNISWWHPLWHYCEYKAPDLIPEDNMGHSNDRWGMDADGAAKLAERLTEELDSRRTYQLEIDSTMHYEELPDKVCKFCSGSGTRVEQDKQGNEERLECFGCDGKGTYRPMFCFSVRNVLDFRNFLQDSGGFEIW